MKSIFFTLTFSLFYLQVFAQIQTAAYSRVKIDLRTTTIQEIAQLGLEADHGEYTRGRHLINDFSTKEIEVLKANGIDFEILIDDVKAHYVNQNHVDHEHHHHHGAATRSAGNCDDSGSGPQYDYVTPVNYQYGSMGGYQTYDELLETLDQMAALYPNLITTKQVIDGIVTHEDRPIYWLRISDNPSVNEEEPEALYTSLHHAREANSLSQLIFYMWYLLENYETDEEIKYLVDHTEMYFIPCVNPDGYVFNEQTDPNGGGLWRKNRYAEGGQVFGVDLNRNYDYQWALDDIGSSNDPSNDTYRGTAGFSEPETQAVRDFCNQHEFKICLNYHTRGNLLIYPWGYNDQATDDHATFLAFSDLMTSENNFSPGTPIQTVGYSVNGVSDDWMYGETSTKPSIFAFTPEVGPGNFGFWPPQTAIDELNKSTLLLNKTTAHLLLNYGEAKEADPSSFLTAFDGSLILNLKKYGLLDGDLSLTLSSLNANVSIQGSNSQTWSMSHLDEVEATFDYSVATTVAAEEELLFLVEVDNGSYVHTDTLRKIFLNGDFELVFTDDATNPTIWNGSWSTTDEDFVSGPTSYTDSPNNDYQGDSESTYDLEQSIDLENAEQALLKFHAKWEIETGYDYAMVMASTDNINFVPLCGNYTKPGTTFQVDGAPLYDGNQTQWVLETIDLSDYIGEKIWIRFGMFADGFIEEDGFYFDDIEVEVFNKVSTSITEQTEVVNQFTTFPNPFNEQLYVNLHLNQAVAKVQLRLVNALGQLVLQKEQSGLSSGAHQMIFDQQLTEGIYFLQLFVDGVEWGTSKVVKLK